MIIFIFVSLVSRWRGNLTVLPAGVPTERFHCLDGRFRPL